MAMSNPLGLIPEQVWDSAPIAQYDLEPGKPSGSAMPLAWAHAEFVKLVTAGAGPARRSTLGHMGPLSRRASRARLHDLGAHDASSAHDCAPGTR